MGIIDTLKNIDINDLKEMDFAQIKNNVLSKPTIIINIVLVIITIFFAYSNFTKFKKTQKKLKKQQTELVKKQKAVNEQNKAKKEYDEFIKTLPERISSDELIAKLSDIAVKHNVQIISNMVGDVKIDDYKRIEVVTFEIITDDSRYKDLVYLIKDIEETNYAVRIDKFTSVTKSNTRRARRRNAPITEVEPAKQTQRVDAIIEIGTVNFDEE